MFHVIGEERAWRTAQGRPSGFESLVEPKPIVCVGASGPLADQKRRADNFCALEIQSLLHRAHHNLDGTDGLLGICTSVLRSNQHHRGSSDLRSTLSIPQMKPGLACLKQQLPRLLSRWDQAMFTVQNQFWTSHRPKRRHISRSFAC